MCAAKRSNLAKEGLPGRPTEGEGLLPGTGSAYPVPDSPRLLPGRTDVALPGKTRSTNGNQVSQTAPPEPTPEATAPALRVGEDTPAAAEPALPRAARRAHGPCTHRDWVCRALQAAQKGDAPNRTANRSKGDAEHEMPPGIPCRFRAETAFA
jgi:hypothetical protein